jgi:hypothetical protein
MTYQEVFKVARAADTMARRIGCRFVPNEEKLRALGLSEPQVASLVFHFRDDSDGEQAQKEKP